MLALWMFVYELSRFLGVLIVELEPGTCTARAEHVDHVLFYESRQRGLGASYAE